jgi:hypothetical protein
MTDSAALQLILGPDKRNPCFCLYVDAAEKEIHVYYGLEVLEVVPNGRALILPPFSRTARARPSGCSGARHPRHTDGANLLVSRIGPAL